MLFCSCQFATDSDPAQSSGVGGPSGTGETGTPEGSTTSTSATTAETTATTSGPTGQTQDPTEGDTTASDESSDTGTIPVGCPEPLPEGWILCEDFEDIADPLTHFPHFAGDGLSLDGPGFDSPTSLVITHQPNVNWSGSLQIRFGEGPEAINVAAPHEAFDEAWVRFRFRSGENWPVDGPGDLLSIEGVTGPASATTFLARVTADPFDTIIYTSAFTCINYDDHACDGIMDWNDLYPVGSRPGSAEVFDPAVVESWHCVVMHARLNDAGQFNGVLETVVDDAMDTQMSDVDYRGVRDDFSFNRLSVTTYISDPQPEPMVRYIDDVVVSAVSIDCE